MSQYRADFDNSLARDVERYVRVASVTKLMRLSLEAARY
jgi:hypothetical protein